MKIFVGITLLIAGLLLLGFFLNLWSALVLSVLFNLYSSFLTKGKKRRLKLLSEAPFHNVDNFYKLLTKSLFLENIVLTQDAAEKFFDHNLDVLEEALTVAGKKGATPLALAKLERLIKDRCLLWKEFAAFFNEQRGFKKGERHTPGWVSKAKAKKTFLIHSQLMKNKREILYSCEEFAKQLISSKASRNDIIYH